MSTNGKTLKFRAAKLKGFTVTSYIGNIERGCFALKTEKISHSVVFICFTICWTRILKKSLSIAYVFEYVTV